LRKRGTGTGYGSSKLSNTAVESSRLHLSAANVSSKRKSEGIRAAPDLDYDQGRSYELKDWDEEHAISSEQKKRTASDDTIFRANSNEENTKSGGITKIWQKMKSRSDSEGSTCNDDMVITMTSEFELSNESASLYGSNRNSRRDAVFKQHRAMKDHKSPSPPQAHMEREGYF
jgi:hypothetical protein